MSWTILNLTFHNLESQSVDVFSKNMIFAASLQNKQGSKDLWIIAGYSTDAVITASGCPARMRLHLGTVNGQMADIRPLLTL